MSSAPEAPAVWARIRSGQATPQEKVDAASKAAESGDLAAIADVRRLVDDEDALVRYFSLQALVLEYGLKSSSTADLCWRLVANDPDQEVRAMAASCLGSLFFASRLREVFHGLKGLLRTAATPPRVKGALYRSLFQVVGRPPTEWPGIDTAASRKEFEESDIDWAAVTGLEAELWPRPQSSGGAG